MLNKNLITISGNPGSGKSTVAKALAEKFGAQRIYVGGIRRQIAKDKNMTLAELNQYALTHPETDVDVDEKVSAEARQLAKNNLVIVEGRTQYHFLPESLKIYLHVDIEEGAKRIWQSLQSPKNKVKRNEANVNTYEELYQKVLERSDNDWQRYKKYYDIDYTDQSQYDFVLDTTNIDAEKVIEKVANYMAKTLNIEQK